jgi:hypothetical protein
MESRLVGYFCQAGLVTTVVYASGVLVVAASSGQTPTPRRTKGDGCLYWSVLRAGSEKRALESEFCYCITAWQP